MSEIQEKLSALQKKGWTLAALADECSLTVNAVEKWKAGQRKPSNLKATLLMLTELEKRKRIPKKRRSKTATQ